MKSSSWDLVWDFVTVTCSFVDICCDIGVAWMFYRKGYTMFFRAACSIFLLAQVSYAIVYIGICGDSNWTHKKRIVMFVVVLPFAQLIPIIFWLQTFDFPWLGKLMAKLELHAVPEHNPDKEEDRLLAYIRSKLRSHLGFVIEAFVEAIPQCLLQTAALCMYPELATGVSIYSILMSITVVASKAYMVSYSPLMPTFLMNIACIVGDLISIFASTTWIFTAHGAGDSYLIYCLLQVMHHGVIMFVAGAVLMMVLVYLNDLRRNAFVDRMEYLYVTVSTCLLVPPVCVVLGMLKLGLIPLVRACRQSPDDDGRFEAALLELLPARLPQRELQRRLRVVNMYALYAEVRGLSFSGAISLASSPSMMRDYLRRTRRRVHGMRYGWDEWKPANEVVRDASCRAAQDSALQMLESLSTGPIELQAPCESVSATLLRSCRTWCRLRFDALRGSLLMAPFRERSPRLLLHALVARARQFRADRDERLDIGIIGAKLVLLVIGLRHGPPFAFYATLYFTQGLLFPVTELLRHWGTEDSRLQTARLPIVLSVGFCVCLVCILVLVCTVVRHAQLARIFIWKVRKMALPKGFKDPQVVKAIAETCEDEARQAERVWLLRRRGLPNGLASEVITYVDPFI